MNYWISFRIADDGGREAVYDDLVQSCHEMASQLIWEATTSFITFNCELETSQVVRNIKSVIRPNRDLAVVGSFTHKICRVIGNNPDPDIFKLLEFAKEN